MVQRHQRPSDEAEEHQKLEELLQYLDTQDSLDHFDLRTIRTFMDKRRAPLTLEGWRRISDQLAEQGEGELAARISSELDEPPEVVLQSLISKMASTEEWAVFVGAGGSRPEPTNLPLVSELLPRLWQKATEINAKHLLDLQVRCKSLGINNIEDLLTAIDITRSAAKTPRVRTLVEDLLGDRSEERRRGPMDRGREDSSPVVQLQESVQTLFSLLVGMMRMADPNTFHEALAQRAKGVARLSVVTTNYDVCIERSLQAYRYGGIDEQSDDSTTVLKLHGSLNWFACSSCDEVVAAGLERIKTLSEAGLFPVVSQCSQCDATAPHLIVPPIGNKIAEHPVLLQIRQEAEDALTTAKVIAFVGYSFNEADEYVLRMVSRAVAHSPTRIVVFDMQPESVQRLKAFLTAHARSYPVDKNVAFVRGDAAEWFPKLVKGWEDTAHHSNTAALDGVASEPVSDGRAH